MKLKVTDLGAVGMVSDVEASDLPPNGWSLVNNARCKNKKVSPIDGYSDITTISHSGSIDLYCHALGSLQNSDGFRLLFAYDTDADGSVEAIYEYDGLSASTMTDVTRSSGAYTSTTTDYWTACNYHGFLILNNGVDAPQYYGEGSTDCDDLPYVSGSSWSSFDTDDSGSANAYKAKVVRSYKDLLIALDITEDTARYPQMIHWSDVADATNLPEWDYADSGSLSGRAELATTAGALKDALTLRDSLIIYAEDAIYAANYIGGQFVLSFKPITTTYGIWSTNCVVDIGGLHVVLGDGVVYTFDGSSTQNILDGRVAEQFFDQIDRENFYRAFLVHNKMQTEVWICHPRIGDFWCTRALIWNYKDNTWYYRDLPTCSSIIPAVIPASEDTDNWDSESVLTWEDESSKKWEETFYSALGDKLVATGNQLIEFDSGVTSDAVELTRTNIVIDDPSQWYLTRELRPLATGAAFNIQIGGQQVVDGPVYWESKQTFTPGVDYKVDSLSNFPVKALKITSTGTAWTLSGYVADVEPTGER